MSFLHRLLNETATYWAVTGFDQYTDPTLATPVTMNSRWEAKTELFIDKNGEQAHSRAVVYTDTSVATGGYLYRGTSATANPESVSGADLIRCVQEVPDIKNRVSLYKAFL